MKMKNERGRDKGREEEKWRQKEKERKQRNGNTDKYLSSNHLELGVLVFQAHVLSVVRTTLFPVCIHDKQHVLPVAKRGVSCEAQNQGQ